MKAVVFLCVLAGCQMAHASDWTLVGRSENGNKLFVDVASIRIDGGVRRAWVKVILPKHTTKGYPPDQQKWVKEIVYRIAFNCVDEATRSEAISYYFEDGTHGTVDQSIFPMPWAPVEPDTTVEVEMSRVCQ